MCFFVRGVRVGNPILGRHGRGASGGFELRSSEPASDLAPPGARALRFARLKKIAQRFLPLTFFLKLAVCPVELSSERQTYTALAAAWTSGIGHVYFKS